jgi:hypothetical protein
MRGQEVAKTDADFAAIREGEKFQASIGEGE